MGSVGKRMLARGIVPLVSKITNTSIQMKKKKATGTTGSGVNIV